MQQMEATQETLHRTSKTSESPLQGDFLFLPRKKGAEIIETIVALHAPENSYLQTVFANKP